MKTINFENLYHDFKNFFDICRYNDDALKQEVIKNIKDENITDGVYLFRFRLVIFKFEVCFDEVTYIGYERLFMDSGVLIKYCIIAPIDFIISYQWNLKYLI